MSYILTNVRIHRRDRFRVPRDHMSMRKRNPAANLSDDLIVEILVRLPERPLRRYKCVSRSWARPHLRPCPPPQACTP